MHAQVLAAQQQQQQGGGLPLRALEGMLGGDSAAAAQLQPFLGQMLAASQLQVTHVCSASSQCH